MYPKRVRKLVVLAAPPRHGPWARAFNHLARQAILLDPEYQEGHPAPRGMALARGIAMMSYRAPEGFAARWQEAPELGEAYLDYQGEKFLKRFHAESYLVLSRAMDTHDVGRGRGGLEAASKGFGTCPPSSWALTPTSSTPPGRCGRRPAWPGPATGRSKAPTATTPSS
jgi:homoserine O-acetyltransferase